MTGFRGSAGDPPVQVKKSGTRRSRPLERFRRRLRSKAKDTAGGPLCHRLLPVPSAAISRPCRAPSRLTVLRPEAVPWDVAVEAFLAECTRLDLTGLVYPNL